MSRKMLYHSRAHARQQTFYEACVSYSQVVAAWKLSGGVNKVHHILLRHFPDIFMGRELIEEGREAIINDSTIDFNGEVSMKNVIMLTCFMTGPQVVAA